MNGPIRPDQLGQRDCVNREYFSNRGVGLFNTGYPVGGSLQKKIKKIEPYIFSEKNSNPHIFFLKKFGPHNRSSNQVPRSKKDQPLKNAIQVQSSFTILVIMVFYLYCMLVKYSGFILQDW